MPVPAGSVLSSAITEPRGIDMKRPCDGSLKNTLNDLGEKVLGGLKPEGGVREADWSDLESRLKIKLPIVLKTFYQLVGKNKAVMSGHNRFLTVEHLRVNNDGLVFLEQNQNVMFWEIKRQDLGQADPPVQQGNLNEAKRYRDADFLSSFLIGMTCWQASNSLPWTGRGRINDLLIQQIKGALTYSDPGVEDEVNDLVGYYEKDLVFCMSSSARQFLVGAKERGALEKFERRFNIPLDYL
jgi:hypothetical protein